MKVTTERRPNCETVITVEVDEQQVKTAMQRAAEKIARVRPVPGFRPGKAPYERVERMVGKQVLREQAIDELAQMLYRQVLQEQQIEPYDVGQVSVAQEEPLILQFTVPTRPVVKLGDYRSIQFRPPPLQVTDAEVEEVIEALRKQQATWVPVTRAVQLNDLVTLNVSGGLEGQPPLERQGLQTRVNAREGAFPWLEQLVGTNLNETRTITYTYPEDSANAGKVATYTVTVTDIKEQQLPNVDDDFAKSVSSVETLAQLRAQIREDLYEQKQLQANLDLENQVLDALVAQAEIDIPNSMIEDQINLDIERMKKDAQRKGFTWQRYLELANKDEQTLRTELRPRAERRIKELLALIELAKVEHIEVLPEEVQEEIEERVASESGARAAQLRRQLETPDSRKDIEFRLKMRYTLGWLMAMAKGEPVSGKIITPEMLRRARKYEQEQAAAETQPESPSGLITDPRQVRAEDWPKGLEKPVVPKW
ncbi:MAG: trigger factor [Anaerolineae bacterium]|nr:trigger factor [Anaerolineae bacterium]